MQSATQLGKRDTLRPEKRTKDHRYPALGSWEDEFLTVSSGTIPRAKSHIFRVFYLSGGTSSIPSGAGLRWAGG